MRQVSAAPDFWNDNAAASSHLKKISILEKEIKLWEKLATLQGDVQVLMEFGETGDTELEEINVELNKFVSTIENLELKMILGDPLDTEDAIMTIHPGAGGTESQDWAEMLYRMYSRWVERNAFKKEIMDYQPGDEAGIKDLTIEIKGDYAYGLLKAEAGVHRLVRISPFDSNNRRHTSFASVFIFPIIDDDVEITIEDKDIRIDTYRASGAGGQHVNKTDSAVRITHIESGIVVQCQNERSQLKNKNTALKMMKARLYQQKMEERAASQELLSEQKKEIGWGSQIRSYVFHPYNLVKDHRTKYETSNIQAVMDGDIDNFIRAYLLDKLEQ